MKKSEKGLDSRLYNIYTYIYIYIYIKYIDIYKIYICKIYI